MHVLCSRAMAIRNVAVGEKEDDFQGATVTELRYRKQL